jgi:branched-chain amino acid transport system ATP-binding protein
MAELFPAADESDGDVLLTRDLTVRFGGVTAVSHASIHVGWGEACSIIGPNGAGKTTLFDAIAGQTTPTGGTVIYDGADVTAKRPLWRSQHGIRRTFQRQQSFPGLSVEENVLAGLDWRTLDPFADILGLPKSRRRERENRTQVNGILELLGLTKVRDQPAYLLPLGQARLLEVGRALAGSPRLLLLDEPTSGMEEADTRRLAGVLKELTSQHRCAVLLIEHDVDFAMAQAQRVYVMHLGEIIAEGTPAAVRADRAVIDVYLGKAPEPSIRPGKLSTESAAP